MQILCDWKKFAQKIISMRINKFMAEPPPPPTCVLPCCSFYCFQRHLYWSWLVSRVKLLKIVCDHFLNKVKCNLKTKITNICTGKLLILKANFKLTLPENCVNELAACLLVCRRAVLIFHIAFIIIIFSAFGSVNI